MKNGTEYSFMSSLIKPLKQIIIIGIWIGIWQIASMLTGLELLLASPVNVFLTFVSLLKTKVFYLTILNSILKIMSGFLLAFVFGILTGGVAGRVRIVRDFFAPMMQLMKALPVAAFIIIVLMWFGSSNVSTIIAFLIVVPIIYTGMLAGCDHADERLHEMSRVFRMKRWNKIRYIYIPQIYPYLEANCKVALGMCWKAGVSAEVIGLAKNTIGSQMYYSKLYLMSAELFSWSIAVIIVSVVFEKIFLVLLRFAYNVLQR